MSPSPFFLKGHCGVFQTKLYPRIRTLAEGTICATLFKIRLQFKIKSPCLISSAGCLGEQDSFQPAWRGELMQSRCFLRRGVTALSVDSESIILGSSFKILAVNVDRVSCILKKTARPQMTWQRNGSCSSHPAASAVQAAGTAFLGQFSEGHPRTLSL